MSNRKSIKFVSLALAVFMRDNNFTFHDIMRALVILGNREKEVQKVPVVPVDVPKEKLLNLDEACTT